MELFSEGLNELDCKKLHQPDGGDGYNGKQGVLKWFKTLVNWGKIRNLKGDFADPLKNIFHTTKMILSFFYENYYWTGNQDYLPFSTDFCEYCFV